MIDAGMFIAIIASAVVWVQVCNNRTLKQRQAMITDIHHRRLELIDRRLDPEIVPYVDERLSYEMHLLYLVFFLDPRPLYGTHNRGVKS